MRAAFRAFGYAARRRRGAGARLPSLCCYISETMQRQTFIVARSVLLCWSVGGVRRGDDNDDDSALKLVKSIFLKTTPLSDSLAEGRRYM